MRRTARGTTRGTRYIVKLKDVSSFRNRSNLNFIGIVVEFSVPRRSSGTDYCTILKIIDQSQQSPELSVNVFMRNIDELPHLLAHKDIILLCNFKVEYFNDGDYLVYDHRKSSFALFAGEVTNDFNPYQASPTFHSAPSDNDFIRQLRNCSNISSFDAGLSNYAVLLKDIEGRIFIDLVCKVLHICKVSDDKWMIFVWDGTDIPSVELSADIVPDENSLPLQVEPTVLPMCVLSKFPCIGTVLRVAIDETYENFGGHLKMESDWVRIRNLRCKADSGLWKGIWTPYTKLRLLSENDNSVTARIRDHAERTNPLPLHTMSNFLTDVLENEEADFTTLMKLVTSPLVQGKFKCIVRFLQAKDLRLLDGEYRMRITLEDSTARIQATLSSEDAVVFFGGHLEMNAISNKLNKLLGVGETSDSPRNPPRTPCCVGFNSSDANDVTGSRQYYICFQKGSLGRATLALGSAGGFKFFDLIWSWLKPGLHYSNCFL